MIKTLDPLPINISPPSNDSKYPFSHGHRGSLKGLETLEFLSRLMILLNFGKWSFATLSEFEPGSGNKLVRLRKRR